MQTILRRRCGVVLDTSPPSGARKDEAKHGSCLTKELVLAEYDRMVAAGIRESPLVDGGNQTSILTPSPRPRPPPHGPAGS